MVTKEDEDRFVSAARVAKAAREEAGFTSASESTVMVHLADERERLRAQLAEAVALLDDHASYRATNYCDGIEDGDDASGECFDETPCWAHRSIFLAAKLEGTP